MYIFGFTVSNDPSCIPERNYSGLYNLEIFYFFLCKIAKKYYDEKTGFCIEFFHKIPLFSRISFVLLFYPIAHSCVTTLHAHDI